MCVHYGAQAGLKQMLWCNLRWAESVCACWVLKYVAVEGVSLAPFSIYVFLCSFDVWRHAGGWFMEKWPVLLEIPASHLAHIPKWPRIRAWGLPPSGKYREKGFCHPTPYVQRDRTAALEGLGSRYKDTHLQLKERIKEETICRWRLCETRQFRVWLSWLWERCFNLNRAVLPLITASCSTLIRAFWVCLLFLESLLDIFKLLICILIGLESLQRSCPSQNGLRCKWNSS